jgi:hypothetical protein
MQEYKKLRELLGLDSLSTPNSIKEQILYQALERIVSGNTKSPKNKKIGKLNYASIHREAGVPNGTIKLYPAFKGILDQAIPKYQKPTDEYGKNNEDLAIYKKYEALNETVKNEKRLKEKYRKESKLQSEALDIVVLRETEIQYQLHTMQNQMNLMQHGNVYALKSKS